MPDLRCKSDAFWTQVDKLPPTDRGELPGVLAEAAGADAIADRTFVRETRLSGGRIYLEALDSDGRPTVGMRAVESEDTSLQHLVIWYCP